MRIHIYACESTCMHMHNPVQIFTLFCVYAERVQTRTNTHTHTHTYIYIYIYKHHNFLWFNKCLFWSSKLSITVTLCKHNKSNMSIFCKQDLMNSFFANKNNLHNDLLSMEAGYLHIYSWVKYNLASNPKNH